MENLANAPTGASEGEPDPLHGECFSGLVQEERSAWDAAVGYYTETVAATSDFSRERFVVRTRLAGYSPDLSDDDRRDLALSLIFLDAASRGSWRRRPRRPALPFPGTCGTRCCSSPLER